MFFWDGNAELAGNSVEPSDQNALLALGGSFALSKKVDLTTDWTRLELDNIDAQVISIGFRVGLGQ